MGIWDWFRSWTGGAHAAGHTPKKKPGWVWDASKWLKSPARLAFERAYRDNPMNRIPGRIAVKIMGAFGNSGPYRRGGRRPRQDAMEEMAARYLKGEWTPS